MKNNITIGDFGSPSQTLACTCMDCGKEDYANVGILLGTADITVTNEADRIASIAYKVEASCQYCLSTHVLTFYAQAQVEVTINI